MEPDRVCERARCKPRSLISPSKPRRTAESANWPAQWSVGQLRPLVRAQISLFCSSLLFVVEVMKYERLEGGREEREHSGPMDLFRRTSSNGLDEKPLKGLPHLAALRARNHSRAGERALSSRKQSSANFPTLFWRISSRAQILAGHWSSLDSFVPCACRYSRRLAPKALTEHSSACLGAAKLEQGEHKRCCADDDNLAFPALDAARRRPLVVRPVSARLCSARGLLGQTSGRPLEGPWSRRPKWLARPACNCCAHATSGARMSASCWRKVGAEKLTKGWRANGDDFAQVEDHFERWLQWRGDTDKRVGAS